jgi:hypothetical protein
MDDLAGLRVRSLDDAADRLAIGIEPVREVLDAVLFLGLEVAHVGSANLFPRDVGLVSVNVRKK